MVAYDVRVDWDGDGGLTRLSEWDRWEPGGSEKGTAVPSTVRAYTGDESLLITWATGGVFPQVGYWYDGLTPGVSYTLRGRVWVPTGSPVVLWAVAGGPVGPNSGAVKDAWTEISLTFTATAGLHALQIWPGTSPAGGEQVWLDEPTIQTVGEDVTARVFDRGTAVTINYGRDQARALSPPAPGRAQFELDNRSRDYLPENTSSPLAGKVLPGRGVRIQATHAGAAYGMFHGQVDDLEVLPDMEQRSVQITCTDPLGRLRGNAVSTELYQGLRSGEALHKLLDAVGWPAGARDIDPGGSVFPWWWANGDAYDEALKIVDSEGPTALLTSDSLDRVVFRDRHHRLLRAASTTAQATWSSLAEPALSPPIGYDHGWRDIVNTVSFDVPIRASTGQHVVVWSIDSVFAIAVGETVTLTATSSDPFFDAVVPVEGTDYTVISGSVEVSLSRTSGQTATISVKAVAAAASISGMQLRAKALTTAVTVQVSVRDAASVDKYGDRSWPAGREPVWVNLPDARSMARAIVGQRGERLPTVTARFTSGAGALTARMNQQLQRDLSDRVRIDDETSGVDFDFFVEQIQHTLSDLDHQTMFGCEKAATQASNVFRFNTSGQGFNDGRFARIGLDDPGLIFRFGMSGRGFNQGLLAH